MATNSLPEDRYDRDPKYKALVDYFQSMIIKGKFTPTELREAVTMAALKCMVLRLQATGKKKRKK